MNAVVTVWMNVHAAAAHAGVSRDTIYTACAKQELRHVKVGGRKALRFRTEWIDRWLEQHASGGERF
jgi:excisionase family DNA binding protein